MSDIIDLANLDDAGFSRLYQDRIGPTFHANEEGRIAAVVSFRRRGLIAVAATLAAAALAWLAARDVTPVMFFGLLTAGIGAGVAYHRLAHLGKKLKREDCTAIARTRGAHLRARIRAFRSPGIQGRVASPRQGTAGSLPVG